MGNLKIGSSLGASEVIQVNNPALYSSVVSFQEEYIRQTSFVSLSNFAQSIVQDGGFRKISELKVPINDTLIYPEMLSAPVFISTNLAIYYPEKKNDDFWFGLFSLDFFYTANIFNVCVFILTNEYAELSNVKYSQLSSLLNDSSIAVAKFPIWIIYE